MTERSTEDDIKDALHHLANSEPIEDRWAELAAATRSRRALPAAPRWAADALLLVATGWWVAGSDRPLEVDAAADTSVAVADKAASFEACRDGVTNLAKAELATVADSVDQVFAAEPSQVRIEHPDAGITRIVFSDGTTGVACDLRDGRVDVASVAGFGIVTTLDPSESTGPAPLATPWTYNDEGGQTWVGVFGPVEDDIVTTNVRFDSGIEFEATVQDGWFSVMAIAPPGSDLTSYRLTPLEDPTPSRRDAAEARLLDALGLGGPKTDDEIEQESREFAELDELQESFVEACMVEAGFEYFPQPTPFQPAPGYPVQSETDEWALRYGLGVSTLDYVQDDLPDPLIGRPNPIAWNEDFTAAQADAAYRESLSNEERTDYEMALWGTPDPSQPPTEEQYQSSCRGRAVAAHPNPSDTEFGQQNIRSLSESIESNPEVVQAATVAWACVSANGYQLDSFNDAVAAVGDRYNETNQLPGFGSFTDQTYREAFMATEAYELDLSRVMLDCGAHNHQLRPVRAQAALDIAHELGMLSNGRADQQSMVPRRPAPR